MVVQKQRKPGDQVFWPKVVLKKWLNLRSKNTEFNADAEDDDDDDGSDVDEQESCGCDGGEARRQGDGGAEIAGDNLEGAPYRRRRNSETLRAQYINTKELRICVGTYNTAGMAPPDGLDIAEWLATGGEPADIYVLGFQEVVPLNAGNVFGAEDGRPAVAWEDLIRDTLTRTQPSKPRYRCYSDPASPSRFDTQACSDELFPSSDTDTDADANTDDDTAFSFPEPEQHVTATPRRLTRLDHFGAGEEDSDGDQDEPPPPPSAQQTTLLKTFSKTDRIGLTWPEKPLDIAPSFKPSRSFAAYRSFRGSRVAGDPRDALAMVPNLDLDAAVSKKSRPPFVRIVSKQMVGIFLTIWVRRNLRKCVRNLKVSTVGVGAMGYIGNKGAVSVSMSIYQTMFCFVCTHLAAGEKPGDLHKRNAEVQEIHRRTHFSYPGDPELPRGIYDHERIFWLGDLNYRIDVPYQKAHDLISSMDWSQLAEKDQLKRELKKGRAFDGWTEGVLEFAPTYKYDLSSGKYIGDDQRGGRRTPAWCDRILSFGKGVRLLRYRRAEMTLSDHRPVAATYAAEVEVFSSRKLQRALTLTDAEVEGGQVVVPDLDF